MSSNMRNCERDFRHPNVDISHLGTKTTNFKVLEIFENICKSPQKHDKGICEPNEKNKQNCDQI